jgi:threonine 3-dehydrogenase
MTDLPVPQPAENEVLVKVRVAAICGTDQHIYAWNEWAQQRIPIPMVFATNLPATSLWWEKGSPASGRATAWRPKPISPATTAISAVTGNQHNCENMLIIGVHAVGGFSDYAIVPKDCIWKLDDAVSYKHGAMLEPMGVAVHGVMSGEVSLKSVVILGCGPIGVMAVGTAAAAGASKVIAVDLFDDKLKMAKKLGADICINTKEQNFVEEIKKATGGQGADVIVDYTGAVGLMEAAFEALKKGGRFTFVGLPSKKLSLELTSAVIYKEANLNGVTGRLMYKTWYQCEEILKKGSFTLDDVIGGVYKLEDYKQAFADIDAGRPGKMLFEL